MADEALQSRLEIIDAAKSGQERIAALLDELRVSLKELTLMLPENSAAAVAKPASDLPSNSSPSSLSSSHSADTLARIRASRDRCTSLLSELRNIMAFIETRSPEDAHPLREQQRPSQVAAPDSELLQRLGAENEVLCKRMASVNSAILGGILESRSFIYSIQTLMQNTEHARHRSKVVAAEDVMQLLSGATRMEEAPSSPSNVKVDAGVGYVNLNE